MPSMEAGFACSGDAPSMMTLVSSTLALRRRAVAREDRAQRRGFSRSPLLAPTSSPT